MGENIGVNRKYIQRSTIELRGLNLDKVWENIVVDIGGVSIADGNTLDEQIAADESRQKIEKEITKLEKQARAEKQPKKKFELMKMVTEPSAKSARNASAVRERKFKKKGLKQSHSLNTSGIKPASMWNIKKNVTALGIFLMNTLQRSIHLLTPVSVFSSATPPI